MGIFGFAFPALTIYQISHPLWPLPALTILQLPSLHCCVHLLADSLHYPGALGGGGSGEGGEHIHILPVTNNAPSVEARASWKNKSSSCKHAKEIILGNLLYYLQAVFFIINTFVYTLTGLNVHV
jgi:hypothetical protein